MSPIQFQIIDAFVKWTCKGYKGTLDDYIDKENQVQQAWVGLFYVLVIFIISLIVLKVL